MVINCKEQVLFDVTSEDLVYGFGLFRKDNSMVMQMQVNPGTKMIFYGHLIKMEFMT